MNYKKSDKKLDDENLESDVVKLDIKQNKKRKIEQPKMSFDVYFQLLMRKDPKTLIHHKAPMKRYVESEGLKQATIKEFDFALKSY